MPNNRKPESVREDKAMDIAKLIDRAMFEIIKAEMTAEELEGKFDSVLGDYRGLPTDGIKKAFIGLCNYINHFRPCPECFKCEHYNNADNICLLEKAGCLDRAVHAGIL